MNDETQVDETGTDPVDEAPEKAVATAVEVTEAPPETSVSDAIDESRPDAAEDEPDAAELGLDVPPVPDRKKAIQKNMQRNMSEKNRRKHR